MDKNGNAYQVNDRGEKVRDVILDGPNVNVDEVAADLEVPGLNGAGLKDSLENNARFKSSVQYASDNGLMDENNFGGLRAMASQLHQTNAMTEDMTKQIISKGRGTEDKVKLTDILNSKAHEKGQTYLGYTSVTDQGDVRATARGWRCVVPGRLDARRCAGH